MAGHTDDAAPMRAALDLAETGRYGASPNPLVGALVVDHNGTVVGRGAHRRWGGQHAEVEALDDAGDLARGSTLYVTLEPCTHHGKTPPCVDAILAAGVRRVVVAMADPNPTAGGGAAHLRNHGVEVVEGIEADAARRLNRRWLTLVERHRPWVALKAAVSLDGRIATRTGAVPVDHRRCRTESRTRAPRGAGCDSGRRRHRSRRQPTAHQAATPQPCRTLLEGGARLPAAHTRDGEPDC